MKNSKILLSVLFVFCVLMTFGQNKTTTSSLDNGVKTKVYTSHISENSNTKSQSLFIAANLGNKSNSVLQRFKVDAASSGYVKIHDQNSKIVAVVFVEEGYNDIQFLCPRGQYTLSSHDVDINDPKMTN
jgi:hypothetical protein